MKTSTKGRARGGGRGSPAASEGCGVVEDRFPAQFPFLLHEPDDNWGFRRYGADEDADGDKESHAVIGLYLRAPEAWWSIVADALRGGMRVSAPVPPCWAVDVAAHVAQELVDCRIRASYDVPAGRLVLIHENEEAIREKLAEQEK